MPYVPISETNVTTTATNVATRGFGTILVIDENNAFLERTKIYTNLEEVKVDFPTYLEGYKAAEAAFFVDPKPRALMIGRRRSTSTLTPSTPSNGKVYSIKIKVGPTVEQVVSYTADADDTNITVATELATAILGFAPLASVINAVAASGVVTISQDNADSNFALSAPVELTIGVVTSMESAGAVLAAIQAETSDFYAIASTDRSEAFVEAMAAAVGATKNVYTYATSDPAAYSTYSVGATDYTAELKTAGNRRIVNPVYAQASELAKYPEIRVFAAKSSYQPGDVIYSNIVNLGILPAKTSTGLLLTL